MAVALCNRGAFIHSVLLVGWRILLRVIWRPVQQRRRQLKSSPGITNLITLVHYLVLAWVFVTILLGGLRSHSRCFDWQTEERLFSAAVRAQVRVTIRLPSST
jgi:cytochrome b561|eukprot:COSAG06_NODE_1482_length_9317_cov_8.315578_11_plen_103_part_00